MSIYSKATDIGAQKIDGDSVAWHRDISQFTALRQERDTYLAELRALTQLHKKGGDNPARVPANRFHRVGEPGDIVAMASALKNHLRTTARLRRDKSRRLRDLEARVVHIENEMHVLQMRILTFEPKTSEDAATMMSLLPKFERAGHPAPARYAEDIAQTCARIVNRVSGQRRPLRVL